MLNFLLTGFVLVTVVMLITALRAWQYAMWYTEALHHPLYRRKSVIAMLDYYQGSFELEARMSTVCDLYESEKGNAVVVLCVGQLKGSQDSFASIDKDKLIEKGISPADIFVHLGKREKGAADTFEEVQLACDFARKYECLFVVANPLQAAQAFMICIREGIVPIIECVPLYPIHPAYVGIKLFQILLTFYSPRGKNPISFLQKFWRRHISNAV